MSAAAGTADGTGARPGSGHSGAKRAGTGRTGEPLVRTRRLTKRYDSLVAVNRLDLEVWPGEIYGLLGPNGAGKTTTILMLLGLSEPTKGEARVVGLDPARAPLDVKRRVGYLPDNAGFYGALTGRQTLRYTARLNGLNGRAVDDRISHVLGEVGLTEAADRKVETYSRGMRQRLGIADALVKDPLILILDEPTIAIDPLGVAEILGLIRRLVDDQGIAVLLSSHLLDQVQVICDRVGIFSAGRLIAQGTVPELAARYADEVARIDVGVPVTADPATVRTLLESIAGVSDVEPPSTGGGHWRASVEKGASSSAVTTDVVSALVGSGIGLTALVESQPSLERIYRRAVERAEAEDAAAAESRDADRGAPPRPRSRRQIAKARR